MRVQKLPLRVVVLTSLLLTWWGTTWVHSPQIRSLRGEKKPGISSLSIQAPWSCCSKWANPEKWPTFQPNRTPDLKSSCPNHPWLSGGDVVKLQGRNVLFFFASFIFCKITAPGNGYISHRMGSSENHRLGSVLGGDMLVPRRATGLGDPLPLVMICFFWMSTLEFPPVYLFTNSKVFEDLGTLSFCWSVKHFSKVITKSYLGWRHC